MFRGNSEVIIFLPVISHRNNTYHALPTSSISTRVSNTTILFCSLPRSRPRPRYLISPLFASRLCLRYSSPRLRSWYLSERSFPVENVSSLLPLLQPYTPSPPFPGHIMEQYRHDINILELLAVMVALKLWAPVLRGQRFILRCDNKNCVLSLNSGRSRTRTMQLCLREIWFLSTAFDFELAAHHIQGTSNSLADHLSRCHLSPGHKAHFDALTVHIPTVCCYKNRNCLETSPRSMSRNVLFREFSRTVTHQFKNRIYCNSYK